MTNTKFCFSSKWMYILPFTALAISIQAWAQDGSMHHQYKLTQVGTLGGPDNDFSSSSNYFDIQGGIVGFAATATADPFSPNCFYDCFVDHAIKFQYGTLTGLGALPGTNSSVAIGVNDYGLIVGFSETGSVDPATGYPEYHAVVWEHGVIKDLGTFGGSVSYANAVNNWGQAIGSAANAVPDQYSQDIGCGGWNCWPMSTQMRAFLWEGGKLQDLGTLGGNDALAYLLNQKGQVAGMSYTNTTPNATTGVPTQDPFLWENGRMVDLGTLGGTMGSPSSINNLGQVTGESNLAGDQTYQPFLWDRGVITNLGGLGGSYGTGNWINDAGDVVGYSGTAGDAAFHGFLYHRGTMTDLGTLAGDFSSKAFAINAVGQIVGVSINSQYTTYTGVLCESGAPMVDINALVEPSSNPSNLYLSQAYGVADSGEILAFGYLPNGDLRMGVLVPDGICGSACEARIAASDSARAAAAQAGEAARTTIGGVVSGERAAWRPGLFGRGRFAPPQPAVPSN
jgi:probable HAF family extracellular repeat protein